MAPAPTPCWPEYRKPYCSLNTIPTTVTLLIFPPPPPLMPLPQKCEVSRLFRNLALQPPPSQQSHRQAKQVPSGAIWVSMTLLNKFGDCSEHNGSTLFPRPHPPRRMRSVSLCIPGSRHQGPATQLDFFQGPKGNWARPGKTSCTQHGAARLLSTTFSNRNKEPLFLLEP